MIYMFLADGFEEIEALATIDILRRADIKIITVGINGKQITGAHDIIVTADIEQNEINSNDTRFDAIILPGGGIGTENLRSSDFVDKMIDKAMNDNKYICAICAAPSILGVKGLLKDKEAICFPGFEKYLTSAIISDKKVVCDGKIITAKSANYAIDFALMITKKIAGVEAMMKIKNAME